MNKRFCLKYAKNFAMNIKFIYSPFIIIILELNIYL